MFLITGVPYKRMWKYFLGKDCEIKVCSLKPDFPYKRVPYKRIYCFLIMHKTTAELGVLKASCTRTSQS